jgi:hypothetical protein
MVCVYNTEVAYKLQNILSVLFPGCDMKNLQYHNLRPENYHDSAKEISHDSVKWNTGSKEVFSRLTGNQSGRETRGNSSLFTGTYVNYFPALSTDCCIFRV